MSTSPESTGYCSIWRELKGAATVVWWHRLAGFLRGRLRLVTFGFPSPDIDELARRLSDVLQIPLYRQESPMIGPWYSSADYQKAFQAIKEGNADMHALANNSKGCSVNLELVLNDPEPGYTAPEFPGGGHALLKVQGSRKAIRQIEKKLSAARLSAKRLESRRIHAA
jgi:hypothetical protein